MATKFFLYWGSGSPPCWRVQLVLEEKKVGDYGNKLLEFSKNEQKGEEVLKWNHRGQLPTLVVDDSYTVNESLAAVEFLDRQFAKQGTPLTPDDPKELAKVLQRKYEFLNLGLKSGEYIHYRMGYGGAAVDEEKAKKLLTAYLDELKIWDKYAAEGDYIAGNKLSVADLVLFPDLALAVRFGMDFSKYAPNLGKYYERMTKLPSVQKTWPPHWKESAQTKSFF